MHNLSVQNNQTMSSLEIAKLTGKRHADVASDIKNVLNQAGIEGANFSAPFKMPSGQKTIIYNLPKRECDLVVSGYSVQYRLKIIDRWHELEEKQVFSIPDTFAEAMQLAADQAKLIEEQQHSLENKDVLILASNEASIKAGEILVREFVKSVGIIDVGEQKFYQWMRKQGMVFKHSCQPLQQYVERCFFTWRPVMTVHTKKPRYTLRITPRGKIWLTAKYMAYLDRDIAA